MQVWPAFRNLPKQMRWAVVPDFSRVMLYLFRSHPCFSGKNLESGFVQIFPESILDFTFIPEKAASKSH
jgi:hypothetical protein